jgi:hypothetical protein
MVANDLYRGVKNNDSSSSGMEAAMVREERGALAFRVVWHAEELLGKTRKSPDAG